MGLYNPSAEFDELILLESLITKNLIFFFNKSQLKTEPAIPCPTIIKS